MPGVLNICNSMILLSLIPGKFGKESPKTWGGPSVTVAFIRLSFNSINPVYKCFGKPGRWAE